MNGSKLEHLSADVVTSALLAVESNTLLGDDDVRRLAVAFLVERWRNNRLDENARARLLLVLERPEWK